MQQTMQQTFISIRSVQQLILGSTPDVFRDSAEGKLRLNQISLDTENPISTTTTMILPELSGRITRSLQKMRDRPLLEGITLKNCMNEVTDALLEADFPILLVNEMKRKIQEIINHDASDKKKQINHVIFNDLCSMLDPGKSASIQQSGEPSIVMVLGLRGVEKTKTCVKYARRHQKKGFKPALVYADDTLRTDAYDEKDEFPVLEFNDLIIVDTSGHHEHYSTLFEEMHELAQAMKPDVVLFVMDSSIGQEAAFDQAQAFKQIFANGVIIVTNIKDNSKAGGALCAVAAAKCPMILAETGEMSIDFEAFDVESFVSHLLNHGEYTLRQLSKLFLVKLGVPNQWFTSVRFAKTKPGPQADLMLRYTKIIHSMTDEELDAPHIIKQINEQRLREIAIGSKVEVMEVVGMLELFKKRAVALKKIRGSRSLYPRMGGSVTRMGGSRSSYPPTRSQTRLGGSVTLV